MSASLAGILRAHFPVSRYLGVRVHEASPRRVVLTAPLAPNRNHSGTAFAGSLNALATLAGWSWVALHLRRSGHDPQVVLQDSAITYSRPAVSAFRATCAAPEARELERFESALRRHGRGRLRLVVQLESGRGPVASFTGRYVATISRADGTGPGRSGA